MSTASIVELANIGHMQHYASRQTQLRRPLIETLPNYPNFQWCNIFTETLLNPAERISMERHADIAELFTLVLPPNYIPQAGDNIEVTVGNVRTVVIGIIPVMAVTSVRGTLRTTPDGHKIIPLTDYFQVPLISLTWHEISVKNNINSPVTLTIKNIYLGHEERRAMISARHEQSILQNYLQTITGNVRERFLCDHTINGFWMRPDGGSFESIEVCFNDHQRLSYTRTGGVVQQNAETGAQWIPLGAGNPDDLNLQTATALTTIDHVTIRITQETATPIHIQTTGLNIFQVYNNLSGTHQGGDSFGEFESRRSQAVPRRLNPAANMVAPVVVSARPIPAGEDLYCCITLEELGPNMQYSHCDTCAKNFEQEALFMWFNNRNGVQGRSCSCPNCRATLTCPVNKYWNGDELPAASVPPLDNASDGDGDGDDSMGDNEPAQMDLSIEQLPASPGFTGGFV